MHHDVVTAWTRIKIEDLKISLLHSSLMANSRFDYHKDYEEKSDLILDYGFYTIIRLVRHGVGHVSNNSSGDESEVGDRCKKMIDTAKQILCLFRGHIPMAIGHENEYNFVLKHDSHLYSRRVFKITSMLTSAFSTYYNDHIRADTDTLFSSQCIDHLNLKSLVGYLRSRHQELGGLGAMVLDTDRRYSNRKKDKKDVIEFNIDSINDNNFWLEHDYLIGGVRDPRLNDAQCPANLWAKSAGFESLDGNYIIVRIDGDKFHRYSSVHNFHKPNDKRALDLMVEAAKHVIYVCKGDISLAYGQSDEFSFLVRSTLNLPRDLVRLSSLITSSFTNAYNRNWNNHFLGYSHEINKEQVYKAWFDGRAKEYPDRESVINYFKWRQIDCHINNLYNTTLHAISGNYVKYEQISKNGGDMKTTIITDYIEDKSKFCSTEDATQRLKGTISSDKHEILFKEYHINYNNELEQFKKGSILVYDPDKLDSSVHHVDLCKTEYFWEANNNAIFNER